MPFFIAMSVAAVVTFLLAWFYIIPKTAALNLPYRWNQVPLGQKRLMVERVLGKSAHGDSAFMKGEEWVAYRTNGMYVLTVNYNQDTLATAYDISFLYKFGFLEKRYALHIPGNR